MAYSLSLAFALLTATILISIASCQTNGSDQSALMNIWNYQIERKVKTTIKYKERSLAVWEQLGTSNTSTADRIYYVTPPVTLIPNSASCQYRAITNAYEVIYDIQLWEKELPRAAVEALKQISLTINENQILPLPFYQARIIWNNPEEQLQQLKLSSAWINNLQQQQTYRFQVAAENNASCQLLAHTIQTTPDQFADNLQLQFTVSAAKIDSKVVSVKSEHIASSQLVASLKNLPSAVGANRYLTSSDYNRMLYQIANQVIASEVTSGDYVDTDDELSLKDVIAQMFDTQKENTAQFDDKMWNSVFWDPLDERPDKVTKEMNKFFKLNQTDGRVYATQTGTSTTAAKVSILKGLFGGGGSHTSTTSMTTDQMRHLLEQVDIESDIEGEKFVPKNLDLTRLNVNDLSRKDLLTSKRIRVRQVDISGVLQVGIGNASRDSTDDQNRFLRQQLNDIQSKVANIHVYSCTTHSSEVRDLRQQNTWNSLTAMSAGNRCPPGKYMTQWLLTGANINYFHYEFTCC